MQDFNCWSFGCRDYALVAWSEERPGYAYKAQRMIQEVMPYGFEPTGEDGLVWFLIFRKRIQILEDAGELENLTLWMHEMIKFAFMHEYIIPPEYNYVPEIIFNSERSCEQTLLV